MKKLIFSTLIALNFSIAAARGGGQDGSGGGGVYKDGRYMTFYSAGLYTEPFPVTDGSIEVPGLNALMDFVRLFPYWSVDEKNRLIAIILPSYQHEYYKVKEDTFDETTKARLIAEFARVTHQPVEKLDLFAVTDTASKRTFLLPKFYQLSPSDQVAILFHENLWLLRPYSTYEDVISAEMAFQAVYEKHDNALRILDLLKYYGDSKLILAALIKADLDSGALKGLITNKGIPMRKILGEDFIKCKKGQCTDGMIALNLSGLIRQYPQSLILNRLYKAASLNGNGYIVEDYIERTLYRLESSILTSVKYGGIFHNSRSETIIPLANCFLKISLEPVPMNSDPNPLGMPVLCNGNVATYLLF